MKKSVYLPAILCSALIAMGCSESNKPEQPQAPAQTQNELTKPVVYQVFTRLFGNTNTSNMSWGTKEQNGVGKFADFNDAALKGIKELGTTHVWYTGVLHHALVGDYTDYGISQDDPDVVKGRAGSPYAIKDYYDVNPDLAVNVTQRMDEFSALIERTHNHGMKVIIDIVPNHVARNYQSLGKPKGVKDFGAQDDTTKAYDKNNNFYYVPGQSFQVPTSPEYKVLGGNEHLLADGFFNETPAKWTGNGARAAKPDINDWYETVKVNYGVKPDGSYDFVQLPSEYKNKDYRAHYAFWQDKELPNSWYKFRDIVLFWLDKGVDGFRYDMAEMVPVEFWSFLNSSIKMQKSDAFLLAEVYNPLMYRAYIHQGKMDYLYDKVGFYDTLKAIMQGKQAANTIFAAQSQITDIEAHMLHFLENHDEQRIASPDFAGNAAWGKPAMVVSNLMSRAPTLLYFGQDVGEDGSENAGFGTATRTSIFDYIGVPAHQAWMNNGKFDGANLTKEQSALRDYYKAIMSLNSLPVVVGGEMTELSVTGSERVVGFMRKLGQQTLYVLSNFSKQPQTITVNLSKAQLAALSEHTQLHDLLEQHSTEITSGSQGATFTLTLDAFSSAVLTNKANNE
ncbi:alpha-amylase [Pseudoalteromonas carrageenovora]|uniref:Alpha-amylase, family GH13 n=1 Tax=Pseudoalteromonas carrageenovora IAM 12662 TaxID=1314868 RepID=A0A2K4X8R2_PSEVC|nr:alpha-amylase family glycosyl hydrolase [Pseudoalteromonas carrageenovora]MBE0383050.1 neopullulanase [Pseudoalteromonas carrageenovora IAM 12662]QBJ71625.1 alpha-amylase [Pseudoalteromonas carrageenovora]GEB70232.1 O-glycosyl hydrolase family 13 [Pseudoalteromonas carrageenovora]SOU40716.1 Putative alpha-amylase, family GH13 [Pseudoalteromonas carrageenovora IAM 12662]